MSERKIRDSILTEQEDICADLDKELYRRLGYPRKPDAAKLRRIDQKCAEDPFFFCFAGFVRTFDEKDRKRKPLPETPHLIAALDHIHNTEPGDVCAISKSRQMQMSWLVCAYACWEARYHDHARVMIQSKKAEDTWAFVYRNGWLHSRCGFIERAMPRPFRTYELKGTRGDLWYPQGSVISALPMGGDVARGYSASLYFFDEACYIRDFEDTYSAVLPMAKGTVDSQGGRIIMLTTAKGGTHYAELVEETEDFGHHQEAA